jgi:hypothetical protein
MYQEFKESIGVAYERFLMRDLTYVFAGFIIIISFNYSFGFMPFDVFDFFKSDIILL